MNQRLLVLILITGLNRSLSSTSTQSWQVPMHIGIVGVSWERHIIQRLSAWRNNSPACGGWRAAPPSKRRLLDRTQLNISKPSVRCIRLAVVLIAQRSSQAGGNWKLQQLIKGRKGKLRHGQRQQHAAGFTEKRRVTIMVKRYKCETLAKVIASPQGMAG